MQSHPGVWSAIKLAPGNPNPKFGTTIAQSANRDDIAKLWSPGRVVIGWTCNAPMRRLSEAGLASYRKSRLRTRLAKKLPLFADELAERELASRPEFFAGAR